MSKIKRYIENWMDEMIDDFDKLQADFEKHAVRLDRKMGLK